MLYNDLTLDKLEKEPHGILFDCGDDDLNEFLLKDAFLQQEQLLSATYLVCKGKDIVAYFSVLNDSISADKRMKKALPHGKRYKTFPAVKIGRFAVNNDYQGTGVGGDLINFLKLFFVVKNKTGCRYLIADAYNKEKVVGFYLRNGFEILTQEDKNKETRAMYFDLISTKKRLLKEN